MRTIKFFFILMLMSICSMASYAYDFEVDGLYYNLVSATEKTCELVGGRQDLSSVSIPVSVTTRGMTLSVVSLKANAFEYNANILRLEIQAPIRVPKGAFSGCTKLSEVKLFPGVLLIEDNAFYDCPINTLSIPNTITSIGENSINKVKKLIIEDGDTSIYTGGPASELTDIYIGREIRHGILDPGVSARFNDGLGTKGTDKEWSFENGDYEWQSKVFVSTTICGAKLKNVTWGESITTIPQSLFQNCKALEEITIPQSVVAIEVNAFKGCNSLHKITFENGEKSLNVGEYVGYYFKELNSYANLTEYYLYTDEPFLDCILDTVFLGRNLFFEVSAPYGKGSITTGYSKPRIFREKKNYVTGYYNNKQSPFAHSNLKFITLGKNLNTIPAHLFRNLNLESVVLPQGIQSIGDYSFANNKAIKEFSIPQNVTQIGTGAFNGCNTLESVIINSSIVKIGDFAFQDCLSLSKYIDNSSSVEYGSGCFTRCTSLKSFNVQDNVKSLGSSSFLECLNLQKIEIGNSITTVPTSCFAGCENLQWINLGASVSSISSGAFSGCNRLLQIGTSNPIPPKFANSSELSGINKFNSTIYIPEGSTSAYEQASVWKEYLFKEEKNIPEYVFTLPKPDDSNNVVYAVKGNLTGAIINQINASTSIETLDLQAASIVLDNQNAYYETGNRIDNPYQNGDNVDVYRNAPYYSYKYYTAPTTVSGSEKEYSSSGRLINIITTCFSSDLTNANLNANLKIIKLPSSLAILGENAIKGNSLTDLYVYSTTPPAATAKSFGSTNKTTCVLHVPEGCKDAYASAIGWKDFKNIVEAASDNYIEVQPTNDNRQVILARDDDNAKYQWYKYVEKTGNEIDVTSLLASDSGWEITAEGWCSNMHSAESAAVLSYEHTFNAGDVLSFDWSVSSEEIFDQLQCYLGDELLFAKSGEESGSFRKTFDSSVRGKLSFVYIKDNIVDVAKDNAVISNVKISSSENVTVQLPEIMVNETTKDLSVGSATYGDRVFCIVTLGDGKQIKSNELVLEYVNFIKTQPTAKNLCVELDTPDDGAKYQWYQYLETKTDSKTVTPNSSGTYVWEENAGVWTSNNKGKNSTSAVMSATIDVQAGDKLSFDWNVSSESGYDFFIVTVDGSQVLKKSGTDKGTYEKVFTSSSTVSVEFKYTKDSSQQSGSDCATVSEIRLTNPNGFIEKVDSEIENATASVLDISLITKECEVYCIVTLPNGRILTSDRVLVKAVIPGDVNADGHVTQDDLSTLVSYVLGSDSSDIEIYNADINDDGTISIADITALIEKLQSSDDGISDGNGGDQGTSEGDGDDEGGNEGIQEDDEENHEYVDLGLPSGTLWATCNVGAETPEDYGDYFAWGEVEPKSTYNWSTYFDSVNGSSTNFKKYYKNGGKTVLDPEDDAAYVNWGPDWCTPSEEQIEELYNSSYTTIEWTKRKGKAGSLITSKLNGNILFLPAADKFKDGSLGSGGFYGYYWSRSLSAGVSNYAYYLNVNSTEPYKSIGYRYYGKTIRPVRSVFVTDLIISEADLSLKCGKTHLLSIIATPQGCISPIVEWTSNNPAVATVDRDGLVTAVNGGNATITATAQDGSGLKATCKVTVIDPKTIVDAHEYVDLGLPSGTLWATCNVGAENPEDYGDYFAWGEVEPKSYYNWNTYEYSSGTSSTMTKYCESSSYGTVDNKTELDLEDDAAYMNWGEGWRTPSYAQLTELRTSCTWTWDSTKKGYTVVGPNKSSLFLPAAGSNSLDSVSSAGSSGSYWSRSLRPSFSDDAYHVTFRSDYIYTISSARCDGLPVRPIRQN